MKKLLLIVFLVTSLLATTSCEHINDDRIPLVAVNIEFSNIGMWNTYGVAAAPDYRYFIKSELRPAGFPYTGLTYTGFGGVLLVSNIMNIPLAYDLACPVEANYNIRLYIDKEKLQAVCPQCGSRYDVYDTPGYPISGPAAEKKYGLQQYHVFGPNQFGGYTIRR